MKLRYFALALLIIFAGTAGAQNGLWTGTAVNQPIAATITSSTCSAVVAGVTNICWTGQGASISCNGKAYISGDSCAAPSGGVASISVNGATPLTGAVAISVPTTATSTTTTTIH
jgi:hypothetical protein